MVAGALSGVVRVKAKAGLAVATPVVKVVAATAVGDRVPPATALASDSVTALAKVWL